MGRFGGDGQSFDIKRAALARWLGHVIEKTLPDLVLNAPVVTNLNRTQQSIIAYRPFKLANSWIEAVAGRAVGMIAWLQAIS